MATQKIQVTRNYKLFFRNIDNRVMDLGKHRKLERSMKKYGFIQGYPIICQRDDKGRLFIKDGQHRLAFAESLNLPVYWVEDETEFDVALVNTTPRLWGLIDFAQKHAANGISAYQEGLDFSAQYHLPIGTAFALLWGATCISHCITQFQEGSFVVKDRAWADLVAGTYAPITSMAPALRNQRFVDACMAVCRVDGFDCGRMLSGAERCRDKLVPYSTRDAYLDMLEDMYNFGRSKLVPLKIEAIKAVRDRNPVGKAKPSRNGDSH